MNTPLRLLVVAGSARKAGPILRELRRAGYSLASEIVCGRTEMKQAVADRVWDIVLLAEALPPSVHSCAREIATSAGLDAPILAVFEEGEESPPSETFLADDDLRTTTLDQLVVEVGRVLATAQVRRERRLAHQFLRESEARFLAVSESASEAILVTDPEGGVLFANHAAQRVFGRPVPALIGRSIERLLPDVLPLFAQAWEAGDEAAPEVRPVIERHGLHAAGHEIPVEVSLSTFERNGQRCLIVFAWDVTERRRAEQALRSSEARKSAVIEAALDAIVTIDVTGRVLEFNSAAEQMFGYTRAGVLGLPMADLIVPPALRERHRAGFARHLATGESAMLGRTLEMTAMRSDGSEFPIELTITRLPSEGTPVFTGFIHDVSERKRSEAALRDSEQKLRTLVSNVPVVLFALDREGIITHSEGKGLDAVGLRPADLVGRPVWELYSDRSDILAHVRRALSGEVHTAAARIGKTTFETRYAPYRDSDGAVAGVIGVAIDVTERQRAEQALRGSEARYRTLFERNLAGVFRTTLDGKILECNESFARIFGFSSPREALDQAALDFYVRPADRMMFLDRIKERQSITNYEMCARRRDGTPVWVLENATLVDGPDGPDTVIEGSVIDITERKRAEEQVRHLAYHDALTGLPNRLLLNDRLTIALAQAHRSHQKLAVFYLDVDRFKMINDSLGHAVGDELLRRVADRLRAIVREGDTVARLGGDEFIILARIGTNSDAETIARKILAAIRLPFAIEERDFFLTTSVGVSTYPGDGVDPDTLIRNADTAMYRAKERGRDEFQLYAPAMTTSAIDRLALENRLRQALQNQELVLYYQPIVDLMDGRVRGAEALLRWRHPERGLLGPSEFITLAEVSGLIGPIGRWVLQRACAQIREWQSAGDPQFTVSVNLSPRQFQQADLISQVTSALQASGVDPGSLDLEITETNAMENADHTITTLWELRRLGVGVSMDDFGTGYSSLNYLKRFPIDRVKLDRSFVRDVVTNSEDAAIVRAVIAMAHTLRLVVTAEGVENSDQLSFLRQHRCDEMQGFLFSPPVSAGEFRELLRRRQTLPAIA